MPSYAIAKLGEAEACRGDDPYPIVSADQSVRTKLSFNYIVSQGATGGADV